MLGQQTWSAIKGKYQIDIMYMSTMYGDQLLKKHLLILEQFENHLFSDRKLFPAE